MKVTVYPRVTNVVTINIKGIGPQGPAGDGLGTDIVDALMGAASPSSTNFFATINDLGEKVYVGNTPPQDTTLIWIDTSGL
jgi:hypothetical protein